MRAEAKKPIKSRKTGAKLYAIRPQSRPPRASVQQALNAAEYVSKSQSKLLWDFFYQLFKSALSAVYPSGLSSETKPKAIGAFHVCKPKLTWLSGTICWIARRPPCSTDTGGLFLPGCIEPDYNLVTYLRGLRGHGLFHGHNAANSSAYISASLRSFEKDGVGISRKTSPGFSSASTERTAHATAAASGWVWPSPSG